jgi:PAS domain S-box-containing protein
MLARARQPSPLWTRFLRFAGRLRSRTDLEDPLQERDRAAQIGNAERRRTRQTPSELERELQATIDTIPVLVATHRRDGVREFGNKRLRDYLGPDVRIEDSAAIIHPDDLARVNDAWRSLLVSGGPSDTEHRLRRADGEYRWHLVRRVPVRDEKGDVIKWYAVGSDIEDQKRAEAALRRSEAQMVEAKGELEATIDTIPTMAASYEPDGARDFVNKRWRDYTGISQEEAKGKSWAITVHPDDHAEGERRWRECMATGQPFQMEQRFRRRDGEYRWHVSRRVPLRDGKGNIVKWYGVGFYSGDRRRAESALRKSEAFLAEAQRLSHTGSFGWNVRSGELFWSAETFSIFGYDPATRPSVELALQRVHPDDLSFVRQAIERAEQDRQAFDFEHRLLMPDGSVKYLHVVAHAATGDPDNPYFIGAVMDVTARKRTEEALQRSEHRYHSLFRAMAASFWELDISGVNDMLRDLRRSGVTDFRRHFADNPDFVRQLMRATRVVDVNDQSVALFGRGRKEELLGNFEPFWPEESTHVYAEGVLQSIARAPNYSTETRLRRIDGSLFDALFTAAYPPEGVGEATLVIGVIDITARKQAYAALEQSEQRYRHLFDYMPVALLQFDARERARLLEGLRAQGVTDLGAYLDANPDFERRVWGGTSVEVANERMVQLLGARDASELTGSTAHLWGKSPGAFRRSLESRYRGETAFEEETKIVTLDGRVIDVLCTIARPEKIGKTLLGFVDVTERVRAQEALRSSEQRYRHLFQQMPIALWQLDTRSLIELFDRVRAEGVTDLGAYFDLHPDFPSRAMDAVIIEEVNERALELFGARHASEMAGPVTRYWQASPDTNRRALESRFRGEPTFQEETKVVTLDGRVVDVLLTAARPGLISDPRISLVGFVDISERVRARELLQQVQADFAHAARVSTLGELTASIAHEVNQPLAAIATNGEAGLRWLDRAEPDVAEARALTRRMVADARRAADVIARIRAMATRRAPEQTLLSVDEVIREALLFLRAEIQSHPLRVTHHPAPAAPTVLADRTQLQQVIVNLAVNAIQAMAHAGTARQTLVIRTAFSDPQTLSCTLEDSGPGITPEHLDHLFDSFFTTKDAGMGLGLPICRSIIEAHGGRIRADNGSAHGGARFTFTLPAAATVAAAG